MASDKLVRFLAELGADPAGALSELAEDRDAVLAAADLSDEDREILADPDRLRRVMESGEEPVPLTI